VFVVYRIILHKNILIVSSRRPYNL